MKRNFKSFVNILLVLAMTVISAFVIFACNRDDDNGGNSVSREDVIAAFEDTMLSARNASWSRGMTAQEIASLENPGDYIIESEWMEFIGKVLNDSSVQTAKLGSLNKVLSSDDARAFIASAEIYKDSYFDKLFSLIGEVGFLSEDVSELCYRMAFALAGSADTIFTGCSARIGEVESITTITTSARINLNEVKANAEGDLEYIARYIPDKQSLSATISSAESGFKTVASFAYGTLMLFGDSASVLYDGAKSGTLANFSENDIANFFTSVHGEITSLDTTLTADDNAELNKLSNALDALVGAFSGVRLLNSLISNAVTYLDYVALYIDYAPIVLDLVQIGWGAIDSDFISDLKTITSSETMPDANKAILLARFLTYMLDNLQIEDKSGSEAAKETVSALGATAKNSGADGIVLFWIDWLVNGEENLYMSNENYQKVMFAGMAYVFYNSFKNDYYGYLDGIVSQSSLQTSAARLITYSGTSEVTSSASMSYEWYIKVLSTTEAKFASDVAVYSDIIIADLCSYVDAFYQNDSDALRALAQMEPVASKTDENYDALIALIDRLQIGGLFDI